MNSINTLIKTNESWLKSLIDSIYIFRVIMAEVNILQEQKKTAEANTLRMAADEYYNAELDPILSESVSEKFNLSKDELNILTRKIFTLVNNGEIPESILAILKENK